jgi:hypothetical protein
MKLLMRQMINNQMKKKRLFKLQRNKNQLMKTKKLFLNKNPKKNKNYLWKIRKKYWRINHQNLSIKSMKMILLKN